MVNVMVVVNDLLVDRRRCRRLGWCVACGREEESARRPSRFGGCIPTDRDRRDDDASPVPGAPRAAAEESVAWFARFLRPVESQPRSGLGTVRVGHEPTVIDGAPMGDNVLVDRRRRARPSRPFNAWRPVGHISSCLLPLRALTIRTYRGRWCGGE